VKLTRGEYARLIARGTNNMNAFLKVLQAHYLIKTYDEENNRIALKLLKEASDLDPNYPEIYINLSWANRNSATQGWSKSRKESMDRAEEFIRKSLELDETQGVVHSQLALIHMRKKEWNKAFEEGERAVSIDPNPLVLHGVAWVLYHGGKFDEALTKFKMAIRKDPIPDALLLDHLKPKCVAMLFRSFEYVGKYTFE